MNYEKKPSWLFTMQFYGYGATLEEARQDMAASDKSYELKDCIDYHKEDPGKLAKEGNVVREYKTNVHIADTAAHYFGLLNIPFEIESVWRERGARLTRIIVGEEHLGELEVIENDLGLEGVSHE